MSATAKIIPVPVTFTLGSAASAVGVNKSTILRSIRTGKISARRTSHGTWSIDQAELLRVYPFKSPSQSIMNDTRSLINQIAELRADRNAWRKLAQRLARNK